MNTFLIWKCFIILNTAFIVRSIPPAGYVKAPIEDLNPPNYNYGYDIEHNKDGTGQGKQETRAGELAQGRYYVSLPRRGASSHVQYFADDWGYHPFVQYSTTNAHSKVSAHFALGEQAVKALHNSNTQISNQKIPAPPTPQYLIRPQSESSILLPVIFQTYPQAQPQVYQPPEKLPQLSFENNNLQNKVELFVNHNQGRINNEIQNDLELKRTPDPEGFAKLVKHTQNLITGADVIDINSAVEVPAENVEPSADQQSSNNFIYAQNEFYQNSTELFKPIVVADEDSNTVSTTHEADCDQTEQVTEPANVETSPRPLSIDFLAPITAALRLQNSGEKIENIISCDEAKHDDTESSNDVEIQKSIPFYIGKFEFLDDLKGNLKPLETAEETVQVPAKIEYQHVDVKNLLASQKDQEPEQSIRQDQIIQNALPNDVETIVQNLTTQPIVQIPQYVLPIAPQPILTHFRPIIPIYYIQGGRQNLAPAASYKLNFNLPQKNFAKSVPSQRLKPICGEVNKKFCDDYMGPIPPLFGMPKPRRNALLDRTLFGKNLRIEYGFKPPMVPSVETDEFGNPLQKSDS